MSTKKDMKRADLIIPYQIPTAKEGGDISSTLGSTLPMAAMFTRNKFIGWYGEPRRGRRRVLTASRASVVFAIQNWLGESADAKKTSSQPAYFSVGMSLMALVVTYLPMFLPPPAASGQGTGTEAPAAAPPAGI
ncbi:Uncharacterized protein LOCC1_G004093 [Lachnellula occidentalis]|uniref:Uncharacterized protein n=1 Tax=Lachnellula occidentalis TaxID=215460 RepID=A0A8H8U9R9_9HELO|nr:Uncharacterized protein LOCC1_G004093 [Lachnellula occidentalis]